MTMYAYGLSIEIPATGVHVSLPLSVLQADTAGISTRSGTTPKVLGVITLQVVKLPTAAPAAPGPFSSDFSGDFGSGFIAGGPSPFSGDFSGDFGSGATGSAAIGKGLFASGNSLAAISKVSGHQTQEPLVSTLPQASRLFRGIAGIRYPALATASGIGLILARPFHAVVAAKQPNARGLAKAFGKTFRVTAVINPWSADFSADFGGGPASGTNAIEGQSTRISIFRSPGRALLAVDAQSAHAPHVPGLFRAVVSPDTVAIIKGRVSLRTLTSLSSTSRLLTLAKTLATVAVQAVSLSRRQPQRLSVTSPETVVLLPQTPFTRILLTMWPSTRSLQRSVSSHLAVTGASSVQLLRTSGRIAVVVGIATAALSRGVGHFLAAALASTSALVRAPGLPRRVAATSSVLVQTIVGHLALGLSTASAQAVTLQRLRGRLQASGVLSAQVVGLVRQGSRSFASILNGVQAAVRIVGHAAVAIDPSLALLLTARVVVSRLSFLQQTVVSLRPSLSRLRTVASPQTTNVALQRGAARSVILASTAGLQRLVAKPLGLIAQQTLVISRGISKGAFAIAAGSLTGLIRLFSRSFAITSPEVSAITVRRGSAVTGVGLGNAASIRRLTGRLVLATDPQAIAIGRGVATRSFSATSPNAAQISQPRGVVLRAAHSVSASVVSWYHLFVAEWAYQQHVLLPPDGGFAEPPSFGPIDPTDQTTFAFDWSSRADLNDPIVSATISSRPAGLSFFGPPFVDGKRIEITVVPFNPPQLPMTYSLRCTAVFVSGRRRSFSIPVPVRTL